jgi:hypothetical protein
MVHLTEAPALASTPLFTKHCVASTYPPAPFTSINHCQE